jgi:hypothetical protein
VAITLFAGVVGAGLIVVGALVAADGPEATFIVMPENRGTSVEAPAGSLPHDEVDADLLIVPENRGN